MDSGSWRELVGPFDRIESPWLPEQGIAPQSDDGCVVLKGMIAGKPAVVIALEGGFQAGSMGEVSGAKMTAALDLATKDSQNGKTTVAVLLLETGGVRLQEANLGLNAVAEVMASILALRQHAPVITVIAGTVGCFGGMSLAAGLSSYIIMTPEARLGLNGPEVIEQESGIEEFDSSDAHLSGQSTVVNSVLAWGSPMSSSWMMRRKSQPPSGATSRLDCRPYIAVNRSTCIGERIAAMDTSLQIDPLT